MFSYPISLEKDIGWTTWNTSLWERPLEVMNVRMFDQTEAPDLTMLIGDMNI